MWRIGISILFCVSSFGQAEMLLGTTVFNKFGVNGGVAPPPQTPTNLSGATSMAWFVADDYYTNGSSIAILTNRYTTGSVGSLTNNSLDKSPIARDIGSHKYLDLYKGSAPARYLHVGDYPFLNQFTSSPPHEAVMLCTITNINDIQTLLEFWVNGGNHPQVTYDPVNSRWIASQGPVVTSDDSWKQTNKWMIVDVKYSAAGLTTLSINGYVTSGGSTPTYWNGLFLGVDAPNGNPSAMDFLELALYTNSLSAGNITTLSNYWRTNYSGTLP